HRQGRRRCEERRQSTRGSNQVRLMRIDLNMASKQAVIGLVSTQAQAESIVSELQRAGFASNDVSALFPDKQGTRDFAHEKNTKAPEGAVTGAGAGGALGGTLGLLAGIGAL